ncbi:MAG: molybdopterin synthase catalytic subunit MoaE [Pseudohongiellaceae bacterium]|jgi:molybdopterin synthase catalytic subunit
MISVQTEDFDVAAEYQQLRQRAGDAGAVVTFTGLVRELYESDSGAAIETLTLEHYPGMTEKSLQRIVDQADARWSLLATRIIHRVGTLHPGDQIVLVATASRHREDAFAAAAYLMDYLKSEAPFWKKQASSSGSHWVQARASDDLAKQRWDERDSKPHDLPASKAQSDQG